MARATGAKPRNGVKLGRPARPPVSKPRRSFPELPGISRKIVEFERSARIFAQGEEAATVLYIQTGTVRLSVLSHGGKEAVVGMMGPGDFLGEGALAAQRVRICTAVAITPVKLLVLAKEDMARLLREVPTFSDRFIEFMLARNIRIEEDLVDQLFNSSEKRLARTLLLLARYGKNDTPHGTLPKLSQETLAEMVGTTRSRVNFFMNKFRKLGFIEYNGSLRINTSLLSVVLHD
jgi:CRP/FNR family cyclic AMP-dependent transcriptional regulator